jgi:hypothetical protein
MKMKKRLLNTSSFMEVNSLRTWLLNYQIIEMLTVLYTGCQAYLDKSRLGYHSVQDFFTSCLIYKNLKTKINKTIILLFCMGMKHGLPTQGKITDSGYLRSAENILS